jgi:hypothetical protein
MSHKNLSTKFHNAQHKKLSNWDGAILQAKARIKEIKRSIRTFESLKAQGMEFPEPKDGGKKRANRKDEGATSKRPVTRSAL